MFTKSNTIKSYKFKCLETKTVVERNKMEGQENNFYFKDNRGGKLSLWKGNLEISGGSNKSTFDSSFFFVLNIRRSNLLLVNRINYHCIALDI